MKLMKPDVVSGRKVSSGCGRNGSSSSTSFIVVS